MQMDNVKKNPRNEGIYYIVRRELDGWEKLYPILQKIVECEQLGSNTLIFLDGDKKEGFIVRLAYSPEGDKLIPVKTHRASLVLSEEKWEILAEKTAGCREVEIYKYADTVLIACVEPEENILKKIREIRNWKNPVLECYYEGWE